MAGELAPPPLPPPCGKRIRFPAEIVLIGSSRGLRPSRAHPEAEGTDSPPHYPFSDSAEIFRIPGRGICKEAIFSPGGQAPAPKKSAPGGDQPKSSISLGRSRSDLLALWASNLSAAQVVGLDWKSRGFTPSRALPELFWRRYWFPTMQVVLLGTLFPTARAWGAPLPYTPLGDGVREGATLSRSPGAVLVEILVSDEAGYSFVDVVSDRAGVGRSAPLHPLG